MTRTAIASLTAALLATSSVALAQTDPSVSTPPLPAPAPTAQPVPAQPATVTAAPAQAPAPAAGPQMITPAPGMAPAADPAATPMTAPVEAPPPPAPPSPETLRLIQALETVCIPLINKQPVKQVAKAAGYKSSRDGLTMKLENGKSIVVTPPTVANPTICRIVIAFDIDGWRPLVEGLNNWAYARTPPLQVLYQGYRPLQGSTTTWSWEVSQPPFHSGLAFNLRKKADGSPAGKNADLADVVFDYTTGQ